ncbi:hypothetical protein AAG906_017861 [Vitis piasezkii]
MLVTSPGGRCWFGVELKTFEISIEEHKGKVSLNCLSLLLKGVESCCGLKKRTPSEAMSRRFLFCIVRDAGKKIFIGWKILASKLRSLGVSPLQWKGALLKNHLPSQASPSSSVVRDTSPLRDCPAPRSAIWLEMEKETLDRNKESLGRCLVGSWEGDSNRLPDPFEFENEAERVFNSGSRCFRGRSFCLEKWKPSVGCLEGVRGEVRHVWVRILGLPLHLWGRSIFKKFGDSCGRFVAVDENTADRWNLKWARVLVETKGWQHPSSLQVVAGPSCFAMQLWWEEEPCFSPVIPSHGSGVWKIGEDEVAPSRAKGSVDSRPSSTVLPQTEKLPSPVLGSGAPTSDKTGAAATPSHAHEVETGRHPLSPARDLETGQCMDALAHSGLACGASFGPGLGKAQVSASLGSPPKPLTLSARRRREAPAPALTFAESPQMEAWPRLDTPTSATEPSLPVEACKIPQRHASPLLDASTSAIEPSLPVEARKTPQRQASPLLEESPPVKELSSPDSGLERGKGRCSSLWKSTTREEEATPNPLSMMLRDGSTVVLTEAPSSDPEIDVAKQRDLSVAHPCEEGWSNEELSKLFHFSSVLGMPVEGHEVEILALLKKLKLRTGNNSLCKRRKKKKSCTTRFERELKRLECSVSYGETSGITKRSGINDCAKRKLIKGVVRNQKPDLVCLLETKVKEVSLQLVKSVGGAAGGLLLFGIMSLGEVRDRKRGYSISVRFRNCADGFSWIFSGVYGPVIGSEDEDFWEELGAIRGLWEDPWCIGGDFNAVRFLEERRNAPRLTTDMRRFTKVIGELGLRDFPLAGGPFTWIGGLNSQAASRLDRFRSRPLGRPLLRHHSICSPCLPLHREKLKALKKDLKNWNKEVVGNVSFNRAEAFSRLQRWEAKENENPLTPGDKWALLEETSWRQKSREIWLKEGDKNTKYFHKMANAKARRNFLSKIKVNGVNLSSLEDIKEGVCRAYQSLLSNSGDWRPSINGLNFKELGEGLASSLEVMFSEEEIFAALSSFCGDKALGSDGFTMAFWLFCWDVVKPEILGLFREFYLHGTFQRSLNSTFLLLIPKEGTEGLRDFRPISLVGSVYKLLAKVLANKLKSVMGEVISYSQHAFVHGRQILDVVLITNEALDSRLKGNNPGLLLKMDIEKAFDHVKWDFLMDVMSKMGFGHRWIKWMNWCCSTATFSILINGSPSGFFRSSRGLRQGDPLSPYLFLFAMEALSQLLSCARNGGFISGFKVGERGREGLLVSHLLFSDDTLIFCDAEADQLQYLSWTFMWFEAISGLKVNLSKRRSLPTSYLGLPWSPYKSTRVWDAVEERFRKRLSLWKRQYLSKGGRLTLLKSTLSSLPTYFLSLFVIPKKVCARLEKIQRDFLWGGGALENKPHLVSWKAICATKKEGGLGIRSLSTFNKALLGKWLWRLANENESLWKQIISSKYDLQEGGWCSKGVRDRYGVGIWKAIRNGWENFRSHSCFIIGDGTRVKFWKDLWCGNQALEEAFPILFNLSGLRFNRHLNDWEVGEVESLLCKPHPLTIRRGVEDLFWWKENKNGTFSVKSFYSSLSRDTKPPFPARTIWTPWVPIRASFFGWEAAWNRLLTTDRLKRFGWSIPNRCFLCKQEEETTDHLLLFCEKARMLWLLIFSLFGVQWVMHSSVKRNLLGWHGSFVGKKRRKLESCPLSMWTIWKERNRRVFDDIERNDQDIKSIFLYTFVNWVRVYIEEHTLSLIDFVDWLATK